MTLGFTVMAVVVLGVLVMNKKGELTSQGLVDFMIRNNLTPTGTRKIDMQTCKDLGLFPVYKDERK